MIEIVVNMGLKCGWQMCVLLLVSWGFVLVEHCLDFSDSPGWVQVLRARLRAVHDSVAFEDAKLVVHLLQSLGLRLISAINDPSVGLLNDGWSQVFVTIPPVAWASSGAARAENALVEAVQLGSILN